MLKLSAMNPLSNPSVWRVHVTKSHYALNLASSWSKTISWSSGIKQTAQEYWSRLLKEQYTHKKEPCSFPLYTYTIYSNNVVLLFRREFPHRSFASPQRSRGEAIVFPAFVRLPAWVSIGPNSYGVLLFLRVSQTTTSPLCAPLRRYLCSLMHTSLWPSMYYYFFVYFFRAASFSSLLACCPGVKVFIVAKC